MNVLLIDMSRNLNRAIRTCYTFGVEKIYLLGCDEAKIKGNLFSAKDKIPLIKIESLDGLGKIAAFEVNGKSPISALKAADCIAIGGESTMLKSDRFDTLIKIPTKNSLCLTAEAALAIGLYAYETQI